MYTHFGADALLKNQHTLLKPDIQHIQELLEIFNQFGALTICVK